jgi:hypothetical protein
MHLNGGRGGGCLNSDGFGRDAVEQRLQVVGISTGRRRR